MEIYKRANNGLVLQNKVAANFQNCSESHTILESGAKLIMPYAKFILSIPE
jgi:hypothetical protein